MSYVASFLYFVVGIVNLLPVSGAISNQHLARLYRIEQVGTDIGLLLRHRAILFGIVGGILVYAAFEPAARGLATVAGLASMVSFCLLVFPQKSGNASLLRVAWIDVVAVLALLVAYGLHVLAVGNAPGQAGQ